MSPFEYQCIVILFNLPSVSVKLFLYILKIVETRRKFQHLHRFIFMIRTDLLRVTGDAEKNIS